MANFPFQPPINYECNGHQHACLLPDTYPPSATILNLLSSPEAAMVANSKVAILFSLMLQKYAKKTNQNVTFAHLTKCLRKEGKIKHCVLVRYVLAKLGSLHNFIDVPCLYQVLLNVVPHTERMTGLAVGGEDSAVCRMDYYYYCYILLLLLLTTVRHMVYYYHVWYTLYLPLLKCWSSVRTTLYWRIKKLHRAVNVHLGSGMCSDNASLWYGTHPDFQMMLYIVLGTVPPLSYSRGEPRPVQQIPADRQPASGRKWLSTPLDGNSRLWTPHPHSHGPVCRKEMRKIQTIKSTTKNTNKTTENTSGVAGAVADNHRFLSLLKLPQEFNCIIWFDADAAIASFKSSRSMFWYECWDCHHEQVAQLFNF